jgi:uncharacterized protein YndB with AHSA1/START domain
VLVRREIELPVPIDEAWVALTDWERQAQWMLDADRVQVVSGSREGVGVRLRVRTRLFGVAAFTEPMEVVGWAPPRRLAIAHGSVVVGTGTWTLRPTAGGAVFTWEEDVALRIPFVGELAARAYRPLMHLLMGRAMAGLRRSLVAAGPGRT